VEKKNILGPYNEKAALAYNKEMDQQVATNTVNNKVEKKNILGPYNEKEGEGIEKTHLGDTTTYSNDEKEKLTTPRLQMDEKAKELVTPKSELGSNNVNNTLRKLLILFDIEAHKTANIHNK
jgi:hypothetical protein